MNRTDPDAPDAPVPALVLKNATATDHQALERHAHQRLLLSDAVDAVFVASWIDAVLPVHRALEEALEASGDPRVQSMYKPHHRRAPGLEADLRRLGVAPDDVARPECVESFVDSTRSLDPARLVGRWYVFEGATNGGRFLHTHVVRVLGESLAGGLTFFAPHGEAQPARWAEFRRGLDAFAPDVDDCVRGAREAFAFHRDLFDARIGGAGGRA